MKQFYEMKARYPDTVLFFQMGDFYETFGSDAEVVSRELEITLTSRGRDCNGDKMPLAGVPLHAGEAYVARMVRKGYRVAICEQIEDPKKAKGIVKRDVVRVITPGTVMDEGMIGSAGSCYLMAVREGKNNAYGLAFLDISTGEFFVSVAPAKNGTADLLSAVARYRPVECIVPPSLGRSAEKDLTSHGVIITPFREDAFLEKPARELLMKQFGVSSLEGFGCEEMPAAVAAAGACLAYARETQKASLSHINGFSTRLPAERMILDAITLRNLEIVKGIRNRGPDSSLLHLMDETKTPMGYRLLRSWVTAPLIEREPIERRLDATGFFFDHPLLEGDLRSLLHRFADLERIAGRISYGNATPRDLFTLRISLERLPEIRELFSEESPEAIRKQFMRMQDMDTTADLIKRAIVDEPPALVRNGGVIREGYNTELDGLRNLASSGKTWIAEFQEAERVRTGIKSLKIGYNKVFGYYIEVTKSNLKLVPPEYHRRQTTSNSERFVVPELQEKEALITNAEDRLLALEAEIYADLVRELAGVVPKLQEVAVAIAHLDVFSGLSLVARKNNYVRPEIDDSQELRIMGGRHPVVEQNIEGFVPNDTTLQADGDQIIIITGANMAGKSTYMRQVALISVMAQTGSFVPASHANVGIVDRIFTRVGAFDDLASGQSTFMVEMLELANILNNVTDRSLVILDEIGRGTSTLDGYAIAKAVIEFLHRKGGAGPRTLFATHFHEIVEIEGELKRVRNAHFAVRDTGSDVVFLRKLIPGATDRSYGIHVARLAGIPQEVTRRSEEILKEARDRVWQGDGRKEPRYTQMLLVDAPEERSNPAIEALKELDPDSMSPKEALEALYDLKSRAGEV